MRLRVAFVLGVVVAIGLPARVAAAASASRGLAEYEALVVEYGGHDAAVTALLHWSHDEIEHVIAYIDGPLDPLAPWKPDRFKAAAMLHTDAAFRQLTGRETGETLFHLDIAVRLLARGPRGLRDFTSRWYEAVACRLQMGAFLVESEKLLERGRQLLPNDPRVLHESGVTAELLTSASNHPGSQRRLNVLAPAETYFRSAIRAGGTDELTTLHLAHVLQLQGKEQEPLALLDAQFQRVSDPATAYLAALLGGAIHERAGRLDQAAQHYLDAIRKFPIGQSAYIALGEVLSRDGRAADAQLVLRKLLSEVGADRSTREPWWWYVMEPTERIVGRLDALRSEARR